MSEINKDLAAVVADIGSTNARFAWLNPQGRPGKVVKLPTKSYPGLRAALDEFLRQSSGPKPARIVLAIAGPIAGDQVGLTNAPWSFSIKALKKDLGLEQLEVMNDFEALALALPHLGAKDMVPVGPVFDTPSKLVPKAVLGPGTGMGMAGLIPLENGWRPVPSEGGYTGLSPLTDREMEICKIIRDRWGRVSVERVLSGAGIVELYSALAELESVEALIKQPRDVVASALNRDDDLAVETIDLFCAWLGDAAGDLGLMHLAYGGVYLAGGIVPRILDILKKSSFRERFEKKGRGKKVVDLIPTLAITCDAPALLGCAYRLGAVK